MANDEMVEGYRDGLNLDNPEPSDNRSHSYRHGFANGRADTTGKLAFANVQQAIDLADEAMAKDEAQLLPYILFDEADLFDKDDMGTIGKRICHPYQSPRKPLSGEL